MEVLNVNGYQCKMKKITFVHGYVFHTLLSALRCDFLCLCMGSFLFSCATVPQQTYLTNTSLSGVSKVAIVASVSAPTVSYSTPGLFFWSPLLSGVVTAIRDQEHAEKVREHVDLTTLKKKWPNHLCNPLRKRVVFRLQSM